MKRSDGLILVLCLFWVSILVALSGTLLGMIVSWLLGVWMTVILHDVFWGWKGDLHEINTRTKI